MAVMLRILMAIILMTTIQVNALPIIPISAKLSLVNLAINLYHSHLLASTFNSATFHHVFILRI